MSTVGTLIAAYSPFFTVAGVIGLGAVAVLFARVAVGHACRWIGGLLRPQPDRPERVIPPAPAPLPYRPLGQPRETADAAPTAADIEQVLTEASRITRQAANHRL